MNYKNAVLAVMLAVMLSFGVAVVSDDADAADKTIQWGSKLIEVHDFDDMGKGGVTIYLDNTSSNDVAVKVKAVDTAGKVLGETDATVPANAENADIYLGFGYQSSGNKQFGIEVSYEGGETLRQNGIEVTVSHNIWKDSMTYILIIAVIITIVVIAYLYMRNAPKRKAAKMSDTTFTELEAERQKRKAERKAERKAGKKAEKKSSGPEKYEGKKH